MQLVYLPCAMLSNNFCIIMAHALHCSVRCCFWTTLRIFAVDNAVYLVHLPCATLSINSVPHAFIMGGLPYVLHHSLRRSEVVAGHPDIYPLYHAAALSSYFLCAMLTNSSMDLLYPELSHRHPYICPDELCDTPVFTLDHSVWPCLYTQHRPAHEKPIFGSRLNFLFFWSREHHFLKE